MRSPAAGNSSQGSDKLERGAMRDALPGILRQPGTGTPLRPENARAEGGKIPEQKLLSMIEAVNIVGRR